MELRRRHAQQHDDVREKCSRVEEKERGETPRRDETADETAERDAEVHRDALRCKRGVASVLRRERRQQRRLRRPERAAPESRDPVEDERLPGVMHEREQSDRDRHDAERGGEDAARADAIRQRPCGEAREEPTDGVRRGDEPCDPERDSAHVVQVDDEKREHDPVPEGVDEPADLENPDVPWQLRIQAAEVASHGT